jgi:hypothetical protein
MRDLQNNIKVVKVLAPVVVSATGYQSGIDIQGANSAVLLINTGLDAGSGLSESNKLVFTLEHSADGSAYSAVTTDDMLGVTVSSGGTILSIDSTDKDETLYAFGYVGGKRYLKITYTETGTVSMPMSITLIKGHLENSPAV